MHGSVGLPRPALGEGLRGRQKAHQERVLVSGEIVGALAGKPVVPGPEVGVVLDPDPAFGREFPRVHVQVPVVRVGLQLQRQLFDHGIVAPGNHVPGGVAPFHVALGAQKLDRLLDRFVSERLEALEALPVVGLFAQRLEHVLVHRVVARPALATDPAHVVPLAVRVERAPVVAVVAPRNPHVRHTSSRTSTDGFTEWR